MYWKKLAAKHEYEELKEGAWLESGLALLRKKVRENLTEKHRNVARKIFLERGWTQQTNRHWMVGHQSVSCLPDGGRHRKAQASPLSGMARSEAIFRKASGSGSKSRKRRRKNGNGKDVWSRTLSVKADGLITKRRERVYQAKSGRCRFAGLKKLGRITRSGGKRHLGGSGTCEGASHQKG